MRNLNIFFLVTLACVVFYLTYSWGGVISRTFHIAMTMSGAAPGWMSKGRYDVDFSIVRLSDEKYHHQKDSKSKPGIHIFKPVGAKESSFVILVPGFTDKGARDRRIVRLAKSFAQSGIGVAVPDTASMRSRIFSNNDIDVIKKTFKYVKARNYVKDGKIAICGFSVAGSYALVAASSLGREPLFILSFGGYYDLEDLVTSVISKQAQYNGKSRKWIPGDIPVAVVKENIGLEDINSGMDYRKAEEVTAKLAEKKPGIFKNLSPSSYAEQIKSPVYIFHSQKDDSVPVEESYRLKDALSGKTEVNFTELRGLSHVTPKDFLSLDYMKLTFQLMSMVKALE